MDDFQPGSIIAARFRIVRFLGQGAVSGVYEAIDEGRPQDNRVAVKVLHHELSDNEEVVARFEREAIAASQIGSPHIVRVLGSGKAHEGHFMVLEYLAGQTLQARMRQKKTISQEDAAYFVGQVLGGLSMAHALGIVHRDLKPENLMLIAEENGRDFVKILDFGASKLASAGSSLTSLGAMVGTPMFMSPEQIRGTLDVDARSDIYACGVILYHAITGKAPFDARNPAELAFRVVTQDPPAIEVHVPTADSELSAIVRKAMAREITRRYQSAQEMLQDLRGWLEKRRITLPSAQITAAAKPAASPSTPLGVTPFAPPPMPPMPPAGMPANAPSFASFPQQPLGASPHLSPQYAPPNLVAAQPRSTVPVRAIVVFVAASLVVLVAIVVLVALRS